MDISSITCASLLPALVPLADELTVVIGQGALDSAFAKAQLNALPTSIKWDRKCPGPHRLPLSSAAHGPPRTQSRARSTSPGPRLSAHRRQCFASHGTSWRDRATRLSCRRRSRSSHSSLRVCLSGKFFAQAAVLSRRLLDTFFAPPWTRLFIVDVVAYGMDSAPRRLTSQAHRFASRSGRSSAPFSLIDARRKLGVPLDGRLIGCVGMIDQRRRLRLAPPSFSPSSVTRRRSTAAGRLSFGINPAVAPRRIHRFAQVRTNHQHRPLFGRRGSCNTLLLRHRSGVHTVSSAIRNREHRRSLCRGPSARAGDRLRLVWPHGPLAPGSGGPAMSVMRPPSVRRFQQASSESPAGSHPRPRAACCNSRPAEFCRCVHRPTPRAARFPADSTTVNWDFVEQAALGN